MSSTSIGIDNKTIEGTLESYSGDKNIPCKVSLSDLAVGLQFDGYKAANGDEIISVEVFEDKLVLHVWADINQEDPTHSIPLEAAALENLSR